MPLVRKRIFVGNLPSGLSRDDVESKLCEFGKVLSVELKRRADGDGNILSSFAFVDIKTDYKQLESCIQHFDTELWCNHKIKLELAKENFLDRLKREQNEALNQFKTNLRENKSFHTSKLSQSVEQIGKDETSGGDESFEGSKRNVEKGDNGSDEVNDKETCRLYGSLPMFSGTNNLNVLDYNLTSKEPLRRKENSRSLYFQETSQNIELHHDIWNKMEQSIEKTRKRPQNERIAEEKRLTALDKRKKALSLQKEMVKKALSSVDTKATNSRKITFDPDEDEEEPTNPQIEKDSPYYVNAQVSKHELFENSSDDDDMEDIRKTEFRIKPHFEGPKGYKLLDIQSRFGNDRRFNLDERFLESGDEMEPDQEEGYEEHLNSEKQHQLNILQQILGAEVSMKWTKKDKGDNRNHLEMVRFDPSNPEHSKYFLKEENVPKQREAAEDSRRVKKKKLEELEGEKVEEELLPTSSERFFMVSDLLKESLKKQSEMSDAAKVGTAHHQNAKGFSFIKAFGSTSSNNGEEEEGEPYVSQQSKKIGLHEWDKNPFKYDSSDSEGGCVGSFTDQGETLQDNKANESKYSVIQAAVFERFHFRDEDPRLQEGLTFFRVEKTFEDMQEGFQEKRADLKMIIKAKVRNNKRKKMPFQRKLGGLRKSRGKFCPKVRID